jgi:hypothetical protein
VTAAAARPATAAYLTEVLGTVWHWQSYSTVLSTSPIGGLRILTLKVGASRHRRLVPIGFRAGPSDSDCRAHRRLAGYFFISDSYRDWELEARTTAPSPGGIHTVQAAGHESGERYQTGLGRPYWLSESSSSQILYCPGSLRQDGEN